MPVLLTTPFSPGDLDPGETYPRAQIVMLAVCPSDRAINIVVEFGNVVSDAWVKGLATPRRSFLVSGTDYDTMIAATTEVADNDVIYAAAKRVAYEWLIAQGFLSGTIE